MTRNPQKTILQTTKAYADYVRRYMQRAWARQNAENPSNSSSPLLAEPGSMASAGSDRRSMEDGEAAPIAVAGFSGNDSRNSANSNSGRNSGGFGGGAATLSTSSRISTSFLGGAFAPRISSSFAGGRGAGMLSSFGRNNRSTVVDNKYCPLKEFKARIGLINEDYLGTDQHDSQEFVLWMLNSIHEDVCRGGKKKPCPEMPDISDEMIKEKGAE
jgi:hypothetical protein